jgi:site-specific recombinase XerD
MRKGQKEDIVYYGDEVEDALLKYLEVRNNQTAADGHEGALFLSTQNKRISNRAVQNLVKKYAGIVTPLKHITPHKLRSTFGSSLYRETGDIYLVATVLGHTDVNTTRKHYATQLEENKITASKAVRLRSEADDE